MSLQDYIIAQREWEYQNKSDSMDLTDQVFCFTGKAPLPRSEMEAMAHKAGASTSKTITRATTILVVADGSGISKKVLKAQENGVLTISPETFIALCNGEINLPQDTYPFNIKVEKNKTNSTRPKEKQKQKTQYDGYSQKRRIELD